MFTNANGGSPFSMPVVPAGGGYGYGGGNLWGNDWISLAIIAMIFGWGGFGYGGFGGMGGGFPFMMPFLYGGNGGGCATQQDVRAAVDQQTLISKIDGQTYGLADLGYALTNNLNNGFAAAELSRCNGQSALLAQLNNNAVNSMQDNFAMQRAIDAVATGAAANTGNIIATVKDCCCDEQMRAMQAEYNAQARNCAMGTQISNVARDLTENNNAGVRTIYEKLCDMEASRKDEKIAAQAEEITQLKFAASQARQNDTLKGWITDQVQRAIDTIKPQPGPAWIVPNPCGCAAANYGYNGYGGYYGGGTAIA